MKRTILLCLLMWSAVNAFSQQATVTGPDSSLKVNFSIKEGVPMYAVTYNGETVLEDSPLGFVTNIGDFSKNMTFAGQNTGTIKKTYTQDRIKQSVINYTANELTIKLQNADKRPVNIIFRVSNNDIAFRYEIPQSDGTACMVIEKETTGFDFPSSTTTFLSPQSDPMIGWMRTKPSYEEEYTVDTPIGTPSKYGEGYTFPALFHIGNNWALISETGVTSQYCASHLSDATPNGLYSIAFPNKEEMNGLGSSYVGLALPGVTPWRTITVGNSLKPIVETTIPFDVVEPLYEASQDYKPGRATWSWIVWQDASTCYDDQITYIDFAAQMGYEYILIDALWESQIGREKMEELAKYSETKDVGIFLWYNSNGYWNDAPQDVKQRMHNPIARKAEMKWLKKLGVKGLKIDFFGSDKQDMMKLYEDILSDANDYGLMIIFHGCTLPRGWERMYPNYVSSEAVLASENLIFNQHFCDNEAFNASLHPFIRNTVGSMDFGGTLLNKRLNRTNDGGSIRRTTDAFQLATAILFQSSIQNFALTPNNFEDAPHEAIEFMKEVPTTWDETTYIDGYPGRYCVLARRQGNTWYISGINAMKDPLKLTLKLPMLKKGDSIRAYTDNKDTTLRYNTFTLKNPASAEITMQPSGGFTWIVTK